MIYCFFDKKVIEFQCEGVYFLGVEFYEIEIFVMEMKFGLGDCFFIYIDGFIECFDLQGMVYGEEWFLILFFINSVVGF